MHFEKLTNLPSLDVYDELDAMVEYGLLTWDYMNQICINVPQNNDSPYAGIGSLDLDWANVKETKDGLVAPPREVPLHEHDFTELCSIFKDTNIEQLYNAMTSIYKVGRVRLMRTEPRYAMSWHYDYNNRLHYPVKTQFGCFMVIEKQIEHLEKNCWYWTETNQKYHTAFNGSNDDRIHMVACIL